MSNLSAGAQGQLSIADQRQSIEDMQEEKGLDLSCGRKSLPAPSAASGTSAVVPASASGQPAVQAPLVAPPLRSPAVGLSSVIEPLALDVVGFGRVGRTLASADPCKDDVFFRITSGNMNQHLMMGHRLQYDFMIQEYVAVPVLLPLRDQFDEEKDDQKVLVPSGAPYMFRGPENNAEEMLDALSVWEAHASCFMLHPRAAGALSEEGQDLLLRMAKANAFAGRGTFHFQDDADFAAKEELANLKITAPHEVGGQEGIELYSIQDASLLCLGHMCSSRGTISEYKRWRSEPGNASGPPVRTSTVFSILQMMREDGWQQVETLRLGPYCPGEPKQFYAPHGNRKAYLACLLLAESLCSPGRLKEIHHGQVLAYYESILYLQDHDIGKLASVRPNQPAAVYKALTQDDSHGSAGHGERQSDGCYELQEEVSSPLAVGCRLS